MLIAWGLFRKILRLRQHRGIVSKEYIKEIIFEITATREREKLVLVYLLLIKGTWFG